MQHNISLYILRCTNVFEPQHYKTNKMSVRPTKTQIILGIHPVWSESSLCTQWVVKNPSFLHANSEDWSDWADAKFYLTDLSLHWAHSHVVGFVKSRLICNCIDYHEKTTSYHAYWIYLLCVYISLLLTQYMYLVYSNSHWEVHGFNVHLHESVLCFLEFHHHLLISER